MRIIYRTAALAALVITTSCVKDKVNEIKDELEEQIEQLENTPLEANAIADNVIIEGSTKEQGTPPTPNGMISLDVSDAGKMALLNEGFDIPFSSDGDVVGAYLQFKSDDGTVSDSYYDINLASNGSSKGVRATGKNRKGFLSQIQKIDDASLDVDFNAQIGPGYVCYALCVYDADGNISQPSEVCITIESWGGNDSLVAKWNLTKEEYTESNGEIDTDVVGQEECTTSSAFCENQETLEYTECSVTEFGFINFNQDGTYSMEFKGGENYLDYNTSISDCEASYKEFVYYGKGSGNWAYNTEEKRLTLVEYSFVDEGTDGEGNEVNEPGEGYLAYDGTAEINGNTLVISEEDYKSYLEK